MANLLADTLAGLDAGQRAAIAERLLATLDPEARRAVARRAGLALRGDRRALPDRRRQVTQKATIGGVSLYVLAGEHEDGSLGDVFLRTQRGEDHWRALLGSVGVVASVALQYGAPLEVLVDRFLGSSFEPSGVVTGVDEIRMARSPLDYVFRLLAIRYGGRDDLRHMGGGES